MMSNCVKSRLFAPRRRIAVVLLAACVAWFLLPGSAAAQDVSAADSNPPDAAPARMGKTVRVELPITGASLELR